MGGGAEIDRSGEVMGGRKGLDAAGFDVFHATLCRRRSGPMGHAGSWATGMIAIIGFAS